jgi:membrane-associated protease RseP (regulator of RpoE activity)
MVFGPLNNFILAVILLFFLALVWGGTTMDPIISEVEKGSAVEKAGLEVGDKVIEVNGQKVKTSDDLSLYIAMADPTKKNDITVLRDGKEELIDSENIVIGDVVLFESGSKITSDLRITESNNLQVDESILTGESVNVSKNKEVIKEDVILSERKNMLYAGCSVITGRCKAIVVATGINTEIGENQIETLSYNYGNTVFDLTDNNARDTFMLDGKSSFKLANCDAVKVSYLKNGVWSELVDSAAVIENAEMVSVSLKELNKASKTKLEYSYSITSL